MIWDFPVVCCTIYYRVGDEWPSLKNYQTRLLMQTKVKFRSDQFASYVSDVEGPNFENGVFGKRLAEYLSEKLQNHGFEVADCFAEDWGWEVDIKHDRNFPLFIGCGHSEEFDNAFLCFIEPDRPMIRRWFRKIDVQDVVLSLCGALKLILESDGEIYDIDWDI